jgi:glutamate carboxypeptidase
VLFLSAHLDTVFEKEAAFSGFTVDGDRAVGPGAVDCKGGVVVLLGALEALSSAGLLDGAEFRVILNGDEETGSYDSRPLLEKESTGAHVALVFEGARPSGAIVNWRKGNGIMRLEATGKSAHAGVHHEDGVNAIEALAHKIVDVQKLTDYKRGLTVNVGVIAGGTKRNIVPATASAEIDVRYRKAEDGPYVEECIRSICDKPAVSGAHVKLHGGLNRPPWPEDAAGIAALTQGWLAAASDVGVELSATATGGGSDGNWTAAMGIPTLDGLGPVGGKYHTLGEYILRDSLPERARIAAVGMARILAGTLPLTS